MDGLVEFQCPDCGTVRFMGYAPVYMQRVTIGDDGYLHLKCPECGEELLSPYLKQDGLIYPLWYLPFEKINEMSEEQIAALAQ